jgi:hypothetical protein
MRNSLENKINKTEFHSEISSLNLKFDEFNKEIQKKNTNFATLKDLNQINSTLETKANLLDVNEALNTKANKESVINALHRKANKNEIEAILKNKIELEEMQNLFNLLNNKADLIDLEKMANILEQKTDRDEFLNLNNLINNKLEIKEFDNFKNFFNEFKFEKNKKIEEIDQDIDRLIENIKKEFGNMNIILNNFDMKKCDVKNFENLNFSLNKKCDMEIFNDTVNIIRKDFVDLINDIKNDLSVERKKIKEEIFDNEKIFKIYDKINFIEKNLERVNDDINKNKEKIGDLFEQRKNDQDEIIKLTKNVLTNTQKDILQDLNLSRIEVQRCISDCQELFSKKLDKKEFEFFKGKFTESISLKVNFINFSLFFSKFFLLYFSLILLILILFLKKHKMKL